MSEAVEEIQIRRADGLEPSEHGYLRHSEIWFLREAPGCRRFSGRWFIDYVALMDGRFVLNGCTYRIRIDDGGWARADGSRRRNNFANRSEAIRAAAARLILVMRGARNWKGNWDSLERYDDFAQAVNWVLDTVDRECVARRTRRRLLVGPRGLVEQLAGAGYSRKWIRRYLDTCFMIESQKNQGLPDGPR